MSSSKSSPPPDIRKIWEARLIKRRLQIVRHLVIALFLAIILQGAFRKWFLPQLSQLFFFAGDIVGIAILYLTWRLQLFPTNSLLYRWFVGLSVFAIFWGSIQAFQLRMSPLVILYGWRSYFLWGYMAFACGAVLDGKTVFRLAQIAIIANIPMGILGTIQYYSPGDAPVNKLLGGMNNEISFDAEHTRSTLTFADRGMVPFYLSWIGALLVGAFLLKKGQRPAAKFLIPSFFCFVSVLMGNGSRMSFMYMAAVLVYAFITMFAIDNKAYRIRCLAGFVGLIFTFYLSTQFLFKDATDSMSHLQDQKLEQEGSTSERALKQSTSFVMAFNGLTPLGFGLGIGTAGGSALAGAAKGDLVLAEDEWARIMQELGVFGMVYVAWRVWAAGYVTIAAFKATQRSLNPIVMAVAGYAAICIFNGYLVSGNASTQLIWYGFGICFGLNGLGQEDRPVTVLEKQIKNLA